VSLVPQNMGENGAIPTSVIVPHYGEYAPPPSAPADTSRTIIEVRQHQT
jgi:hypothetical protein